MQMAVSITLRFLAVVSVLAACGKRATPEATPSAAASGSVAASGGAALTSEQLETVKRLSENVHAEHWTFPTLEVARSGSAEVLEHIALTSEQPSLIAASLHALQRTAHRRGLGSVASDPETLQLLEKHVASREPVVLFRALGLARLVLRSPGAPAQLLDRVVEAGARHASGAGRHAVLVALSELSPKLPASPPSELAATSLDDPEPFVVSMALANLARSPDALRDPGAVQRRATALVSHPDAGVRGRALTLLSLIEPRAAALPQHWVNALGDESAFVRAQAAMAFGRWGNASAIHHLVGLVDDGESCLYVLRGFRTLDGAPGSLKHRVFGVSSVAGAARVAIAELAKSEPKLSPLPGREGSEGAQSWKLWYQQNRAALGKVRGTPPPKRKNTSQATTDARHEGHAH